MNNELVPYASAIILAGGKSRRMGRDKALLEFEGEPLIVHVIRHVRSICSEVIIVSNDVDTYAQFGIRIVSDVHLGKGSLGGVYSGLLAVRSQNALAVACDMPFLNESLLHYLVSLAPQYDVVIPCVHDPLRRISRPPHGATASEETIVPRKLPLAKELGLHPLHAVYSKRCLISMEERLNANDLRLISFHAAVNVRVIESDEIDRFDPEHLSFFNVNTPDDFKIASQLVHRIPGTNRLKD